MLQRTRKKLLIDSVSFPVILHYNMTKMTTGDERRSLSNQPRLNRRDQRSCLFFVPITGLLQNSREINTLSQKHVKTAQSSMMSIFHLTNSCESVGVVAFCCML